MFQASEVVQLRNTCLSRLLASAKLIANSKASFEANTGSQMSEDEEKKMIEKLRVRYPGVANK